MRCDNAPGGWHFVPAGVMVVGNRVEIPFREFRRVTARVTARVTTWGEILHWPVT
jgi:hypothetical protein